MIEVKDYEAMTLEELQIEIAEEYNRLKSANEKLMLENIRLSEENKRLIKRLQHSEYERFKQFYD